MEKTINLIKTRVKNVIKKIKNKKVILFVCTGNTCRSPMAEMIFKEYISSRDLSGEYSVESAGLSVTENGINVLAKEALLLNGVKCSKHVPRQLDVASVLEAYKVICMEQIHKDLIVRAVGELDHIKTVDEITERGDIPDPYGTDFNKYTETVKRIMTMSEKLLEDLLSLRALEEKEEERNERNKKTRKPEKEIKAEKVKQSKKEKREEKPPVQERREDTNNSIETVAETVFDEELPPQASMETLEQAEYFVSIDPHEDVSIEIGNDSAPESETKKE